MRFVAPAREAVAPTTFAHPIYADWARHAGLLIDAWPTVEALDALLSTAGTPARHAYSGAPLRFAAQTPALLADGLHYERRIHDTGRIATRPANWHDLFNALVWIERRPLKCAVNRAYVRAFGSPAGAPARSRAQCALTHFDEAGALVLLRDRALLDCWDRHDWHGLFWRHRAAWRGDAACIVFGHALLEHHLLPRAATVAKCVVLLGDWTSATAIAEVAADLAAGRLLRDPAELRPLPLAGIPGWHPGNARAAFLREAPCFRPLRPGRRYPPPLCPACGGRAPGAGIPDFAALHPGFGDRRGTDASPRMEPQVQSG
jgi:hypothetical protein